MKKILVIGATSAIAEHCSRLWAARGYHLFLVARDKERLDSIAADLRVRGSLKVSTHCIDVNDFSKHVAMLDRATLELKDIDAALIAHGSLADHKECEQNVEFAMREISTNALSVIALLTQLANRFEAKGSGTIAVISSVAGDRGRKTNYVYGSAKAMVSTFTSGLRQRLYRAGVAVVTIKPGLVDSPMTKHYEKGVLWAMPANVAATIVGAIDKRRDVVYVPWFWRVIMMLVKSVPERLFKMINEKPQWRK